LDAQESGRAIAERGADSQGGMLRLRFCA